MNLLKPAFQEKNIPVVMSADNNYAPILGVCIKSLIENSTPDNNYDIIVLTQDITNYNQHLIHKMQQDNVSIRFFNVKPFIDIFDEGLFATNTFYTIATYFRLFLPYIMLHYDKVLYLDCDMVILRDVAELYHIDIEENYIGATRDLSIINSRAASNMEYYTVGMEKYLQEDLKLHNIDDYFQAGVLIWNARKMREDNLVQTFLTRLKELGIPRYVDQCVLNSVCTGHVKFIPQNWDVVWDIPLYYPNYRQVFPTPYKNQYLEGLADPYILHLTGGYKPWNNPSIDMSEYFWQYARMTPFYEQILHKRLQDKADQANSFSSHHTITRGKRKSFNKFLSEYKSIRRRHKIYGLLSRVTFGNIKNKTASKKEEYKIKRKAMEASIFDQR